MICASVRIDGSSHVNLRIVARNYSDASNCDDGDRQPNELVERAAEMR
jgi:hypothetical protein